MEELEFDKIKQLLNVCYQCGTCVSSCAAGIVSAERNIRKLVQNVIDAEDEWVITENELLWLCSTCYQCEDRCPEGIPLTSLLIRLKNMAAQKGCIPASVRREIEALASYHYTYPPLKSMRSRRKRLGLPDLPRPNETEMRTLMRLVQSDDETEVQEDG
jgi:heterodisulfide reductase subunit C